MFFSGLLPWNKNHKNSFLAVKGYYNQWQFLSWECCLTLAAELEPLWIYFTDSGERQTGKRENWPVSVWFSFLPASTDISSFLFFLSPCSSLIPDSLDLALYFIFLWHIINHFLLKPSSQFCNRWNYSSFRCAKLLEYSFDRVFTSPKKVYIFKTQSKIFSLGGSEVRGYWESSVLSFLRSNFLASHPFLLHTSFSK